MKTKSERAVRKAGTRMVMLLSTVVALLSAADVAAQDDPVIMTINGEDILRSEFEYSYNKNNTEGVIDKKTVKEYVDLFINYKLKVVAAVDEHMDTLKSFQKEFAMYRNQQVIPSFATDEAMEAEARKVYQNTKNSIGPQGLIMPAHILLSVSPDATQEQQAQARQRIDSIYNALLAGADFEEAVRLYSDDRATKSKGGRLPWVSKGQTLKEFEEAAFALEKGQMSAPVLSSAGWHIILMTDRKQLEPYDSLRSNIYNFMEARGFRDRVASAVIDSIAAGSDGALTREDVLSQRAAEMSAVDSDLKYLIREYHDGLLLYEISSREVWDKAAKDKEGLARYFAKNKKKYAWEEPRFKGIAYHVKDQADIEAVRRCVEDLPFSRWSDVLRKTFNNDSIIRIRVEKGIFKLGDNAFIDSIAFGRNVSPKPLKNYPYDAVYGHMIDVPEDYEDVRGLVTADYQEMLEKEWVADLRRRYPVTVNKKVVDTVNKHD